MTGVYRSFKMSLIATCLTPPSLMFEMALMICGIYSLPIRAMASACCFEMSASSFSIRAYVASDTSGGHGVSSSYLLRTVIVISHLTRNKVASGDCEVETQLLQSLIHRIPPPDFADYPKDEDDEENVKRIDVSENERTGFVGVTFHCFQDSGWIFQKVGICG